MNTTIDWREENGHVAISQPGPGLARLFGVPFLAAGGYLLYQFLDGVFHPGELTIAGWTLLPLVALAFFVPGWLIATFRKHATIGTSERVIAEEYDFLVYTWRTRTSIASDAHVMYRYERGSSRTSSAPLYWIHVYVVSGTKQILLALFRDGEKAAAASFAQRLGAYLRVPVKDQLVERGEVTSGGVVVEHADEDDTDT